MSTGDLSLIPLAGLPIGSPPIVVDAATGAVRGRAADCTVCVDHPAVSRRHARIEAVAGMWAIRDLGSTHGTRVDGETIPKNSPIPLRSGSRIDLGPVALRVQRGADAAGHALRSTMVDTSGSAQARVVSAGGAIAARRLDALLRIVAAVQQSKDEAAVFAAVMPALLDATGFARCIQVGGLSADGGVQIRAEYPAGSSVKPLSRTLLNAASTGNTVELADQPDLAGAASLIVGEVVGAVCAPVVIDGLPECYLYLDASGDHVPATDSGPFCRSVALIVAMSCANIRREAAEAERLALREDLGAARAAQERLMPPLAAEFGVFRYRLASVPGRFVAGDIIGLSDASATTTLYLGDVSGKGAGAAMLMSAIQSFLEAQLRCGRGVLAATNALSAFVGDRAGAGRFATMFLTSFDEATGQATAIDAGHGYAVLVHPVTGPQMLACEGGPPIGAVAGWEYECSSFEWPVGGRLVLLSDGVAEQLDASGVQLGTDRVLSVLGACQSVDADVQAILTTLEAHAGGTNWADDVTVVSVERMR